MLKYNTPNAENQSGTILDLNPRLSRSFDYASDGIAASFRADKPPIAPVA